MLIKSNHGVSNAIVTLILLSLVVLSYMIIAPYLPKTFPSTNNINTNKPEFKLTLIKAYTYNNIGYIILYNYGDQPITIIKIINGNNMISKNITLPPNTITELKITNPQPPITLITTNGISIKIQLETT
jgi:hypothetical protein